MREYGRVYCAFWTSQDVQSMSDDAKMLALYLLTCSHGTIIGACRLTNGYVCDDLGWSSQRVSKGFDELFRKGFANRCETTKWTWITRFLQWNAPENPNQWKAAIKVVHQIPDQCSWKPYFLWVFAKANGQEPPEGAKPFETVSKPFRNLNQDLEQEQDLEHKGELKLAPPPNASDPLRPKTGKLARSRTAPDGYDFEGLREWAAEKCPNVDFDRQIELLRNYEFKDAKSDWDKVARGWLLRNDDRPASPNGRAAESVRKHREMPR